MTNEVAIIILYARSEQFSAASGTALKVDSGVVCFVV